MARSPSTSTIILGASKPEQVLDNLKALEIIPKLTPEIMNKIEEILKNKPAPIVRLSLYYEWRLTTNSLGFVWTPALGQVRAPLLVS